MITAKATKPKKPATKSSFTTGIRSEEHTSELQSQSNLVCRLLLEKKKKSHLHSQSLRRVEPLPAAAHCSLTAPLDATTLAMPETRSDRRDLDRPGRPPARLVVEQR